MQKDIADKYNAFATPAGNIIWGGALSLAWLDLKNTFKLEQIELATSNPHILAIARNFNSSPFQIDHISKDSLYVKTGYGPQTQNKINTEMKKKFSKATIGEINFKLNPTDIIAYAYLSKAISFKVKFERKQQQFLFNGKATPSFWARTEAQKKQVICHHYESLVQFVVHIPDADGKDMMFLVKSPKQLTVDQAIATVIHFEKKPSAPLQKQDFFEMPCVELNNQRVLEQLAGIQFANNALKEYMIAVVLEKIKLSIDQSGAKVENMGVVVARKSKALREDPIVPKYVLLDRTFWVVMKQPNKHPYFCAQITVPKE